MLIIPAIDLKGGCVVRLTQGKRDQQVVYSHTPETVALLWQRAGAKMIHIVDLDGAFEGHRQNLGSLKNIMTVVNASIQFGGGLRTFDDVREILESGVSRAVLGTKATDIDFLKNLLKTFAERIAVGVDVKDKIIQTHGWVSGDAKYELLPFCKQLQDMGVKTIIYTDIHRDGMLMGPNIKGLEQLLNDTSMDIILSGGISNLYDLKQLSKIKTEKFKGVIIGKALYEQKIDLKEAIE